MRTNIILRGKPNYRFTLSSWKQKTNLMSLAFLFTSYALNMFRTLIYPSSGACDYSVELPRWSCVLGSMCVGFSVWLGWRGIPTTSKHQHTSNQEHTTNVVIQQNSRKLLMMDILMSKHVERVRSGIKIASDIKLVCCFQLLQRCTFQ